MPRSDEANEAVRGATRQKILDAARRVFAKDGRRATMADVAAEAGVSQGLAYRYFSSKEILLAEVVREAAEAGGGPAKRVSEIRGAPHQRLATLLGNIIQARRERPEFYRLLYQTLRDDDTGSPLRQTVAKNSKVMTDAIRRLIVEAQAEGTVADDDPEQLFTAITAAIDGLTTLGEGREGPGPVFPDAHIILRMLRPDPH